MRFDKGVWVIGAGGLGSALSAKCQNVGINCRLISRPEHDLTQQEDVKRVFNSIDQVPSLIINTIGTLYDDNNKPEKSLTSFDADWFYESLRVNTMPVMWIAQALTEKLDRKDHLIFITLSARVSSISDNHLGGWYSYRASKCALNMFIKNISIEWSRRFPQVSICGYHPGTVDTQLSQPFQKNIAPETLFTPQKAADYLFSHIQKMTPSMSGSLFDWKGEVIQP